MTSFTPLPPASGPTSFTHISGPARVRVMPVDVKAPRERRERRQSAPERGLHTTNGLTAEFIIQKTCENHDCCLVYDGIGRNITEFFINDGATARLLVRTKEQIEDGDTRSLIEVGYRAPDPVVLPFDDVLPFSDMNRQPRPAGVDPGVPFGIALDRQAQVHALPTRHVLHDPALAAQTPNSPPRPAGPAQGGYHPDVNGGAPIGSLTEPSPSEPPLIDNSTHHRAEQWQTTPAGQIPVSVAAPQPELAQNIEERVKALEVNAANHAAGINACLAAHESMGIRLDELGNTPQDGSRRNMADVMNENRVLRQQLADCVSTSTLDSVLGPLFDRLSALEGRQPGPTAGPSTGMMHPQRYPQIQQSTLDGLADTVWRLAGAITNIDARLTACSKKAQDTENVVKGLTKSALPAIHKRQDREFDKLWKKVNDITAPEPTNVPAPVEVPSDERLETRNTAVTAASDLTQKPLPPADSHVSTSIGQPESAAPTTEPETAAPTTVPERVAPSTVPETVAPTTVPETVAPPTVPETVAPPTVPSSDNATVDQSEGVRSRPIDEAGPAATASVLDHAERPIKEDGPAVPTIVSKHTARTGPPPVVGSKEWAESKIAADDVFLVQAPSVSKAKPSPSIGKTTLHGDKHVATSAKSTPAKRQVAPVKANASTVPHAKGKAESAMKPQQSDEPQAGASAAKPTLRVTSATSNQVTSEKTVNTQAAPAITDGTPALDRSLHDKPDTPDTREVDTPVTVIKGKGKGKAAPRTNKRPSRQTETPSKPSTTTPDESKMTIAPRIEQPKFCQADKSVEPDLVKEESTPDPQGSQSPEPDPEIDTPPIDLSLEELNEAVDMSGSIWYREDISYFDILVGSVTADVKAGPTIDDVTAAAEATNQDDAMPLPTDAPVPAPSRPGYQAKPDPAALSKADNLDSSTGAHNSSSDTRMPESKSSRELTPPTSEPDDPVPAQFTSASSSANEPLPEQPLASSSHSVETGQDEKADQSTTSAQTDTPQTTQSKSAAELERRRRKRLAQKAKQPEKEKAKKQWEAEKEEVKMQLDSELAETKEALQQSLLLAVTSGEHPPKTTLSQWALINLENLECRHSITTGFVPKLRRWIEREFSFLSGDEDQGSGSADPRLTMTPEAIRSKGKQKAISKQKGPELDLSDAELEAWLQKGLDAAIRDLAASDSTTLLHFALSWIVTHPKPATEANQMRLRALKAWTGKRWREEKVMRAVLSSSASPTKSDDDTNEVSPSALTMARVRQSMMELVAGSSGQDSDTDLAMAIAASDHITRIHECYPQDDQLPIYRRWLTKHLSDCGQAVELAFMEAIMKKRLNYWRAIRPGLNKTLYIFALEWLRLITTTPSGDAFLARNVRRWIANHEGTVDGTVESGAMPQQEGVIGLGLPTSSEEARTSEDDSAWFDWDKVDSEELTAVIFAFEGVCSIQRLRKEDPDSKNLPRAIQLLVRHVGDMSPNAQLAFAQYNLERSQAREGFSPKINRNYTLYELAYTWLQQIIGESREDAVDRAALPGLRRWIAKEEADLPATSPRLALNPNGKRIIGIVPSRPAGRQLRRPSFLLSSQDVKVKGPSSSASAEGTILRLRPNANDYLTPPIWLPIRLHTAWFNIAVTDDTRARLEQRWNPNWSDESERWFGTQAPALVSEDMRGASPSSVPGASPAARTAIHRSRDDAPIVDPERPELQIPLPPSPPSSDSPEEKMDIFEFLEQHLPEPIREAVDADVLNGGSHEHGFSTTCPASGQDCQPSASETDGQSVPSQSAEQPDPTGQPDSSTASP